MFVSCHCPVDRSLCFVAIRVAAFTLIETMGFQSGHDNHRRCGPLSLSLEREREGRGRDEKRDERREEKREVGREREKREVIEERERGEREKSGKREREEEGRKREEGGRDESNLKNAGEAGNLQSRPGSPLGRPTSQVAGGAGAPAGGARDFSGFFFLAHFFDQ